MKHRVENMVSKNIREFTADDTIYIKKMQSKFQIMYFCKFFSFKSGIVTAEVINRDDTYSFPDKNPGEVITARITNCAMYVPLKDFKCFHWFDKSGDLK